MGEGATRGAIEHRLAVQRLRRLHAGVYAVGPILRAEGRYLAAVLSYGEGARLSHQSAGALWGLRPSASGRIHISVMRRSRPRDGIVVHETGSWLAADLAEHDAIPCTAVARTLVDLAGVLNSAGLRAVLERAVMLNLFDGGPIHAALSRARGRRGVALLRRLLAELADEPPFVRSELERLLLELIRQAELPMPIVNGRIGDYEVDFHWPAHRLVVETDGRASHANAAAFERDRDRDLALELAGRRVIRITWRQLTQQPDRVVAMLRARLG